MQIRALTLTDAEELLNISKKTFFDAFAHLNTAEDMKLYSGAFFKIDQVKKELTTPGSVFYFVEDEGNTIGYIKLNFDNAQTEFQDGNALEIERIYVLDEHQNKQVGKLLIDHAVGIAQSKKLAYIWLGVFERNGNAIRFYQRNGFKIFSKHYFMLGNDKQTDVLMRKEL